MVESDLLLMLLVIFLPSAFAVSLLFFPSNSKETIRWWSLFGSACTLTLSLCLFVEYYAMLEMHLDPSGKPLHGPGNRLENRVEDMLSADVRPVPDPRKSDDWVSRVKWIERFNIYFAVGVDGISMPLILLTTIVTFLSVLASWGIEKQVKGYMALLLFLETGVLGAFMSLDLFLFFVFYEVMLLPMYFLIGIWGGGRRKYAALKFVLYTLLGSVFILIALIGLYFINVRDLVDQNLVAIKAEEIHLANPKIPLDLAKEQAEVHTFDLVTLQRAGQAMTAILNKQDHRLVASNSPEAKDPEKLPLLGRGVDRNQAIQRLRQQWFCSPTAQLLFFSLLFVGFAIKVPLFPLHSWLPDAHVEAPTPISMILAGILLKLGGYGIIRLAYPICPYAAEQLAWVVALLGAFAIIYGAFVAMGQTDFKKLLAYSSISHMGYVILGFAVWSSTMDSQYWSWGMNGAMFQMVSHGVTSAGLFLVVGILYDRAHHREINHFGGIMNSMPLYAGMSAILFFASMGLPSLCGFVGELFVVLGTWKFNPYFGLVAILTTILTAAYLLWTWQRVYLGTNSATSQYPDLSLRETICLGVFVVLAIALGILPQITLLNWMEPSVTGLVETLSRLSP
jgi:NADH-quinone oxidoreductase subunit M